MTYLNKLFLILIYIANTLKMDSPKKRNKEQSRQQFLQAVGEILKNKGYAALKINSIAQVAGLDKKLIYNYFGGLEGLLDAYVKTQDFWSNVKNDIIEEPMNDGGKEFLKNQLQSQMTYMDENNEFQKVILWRLSEERASLKKLGDAQEANGEVILTKVADPYFGKNAQEFRAITAVVVSGLYYLSLSNATNANTFCGIDYKSPEGKKLITSAKDFILDQAYSILKD